jgi:cyclopropane-fatty-acyl-phospholipid synthase
MSWLKTVDPLFLMAARKLLEAIGNPPVRMVLWNGAEAGCPAGEAVGTLRVLDAGALVRLVYDPELELGDLYTEGRIAIDGKLPEVFKVMSRGGFGAGLVWKMLPRRLIDSALRNDQASARQNIHHHYDLGNAFYELWLDPRMVYTCAYYPTPVASLEEAQLAKLEHVCRKLDLRPGQEVIEAGCGWGSLALHMARHHGVKVRAFNISHEQIVYARRQAEKQGLSDRVELIEDDYRNITGRCDAFVSVGMLEHVGPAHYAELGAVIERCLAPHGLGLLHTIGHSQPGPLSRWIERRIFPSSYAPTLREMMDVLEPYDFVALDVENLRLHYSRTGQHWLDRFEQEAERIEEMYGPAFVRQWRFYLACVVAGFHVGWNHLFQVLFSRATNNQIPWTRQHVYRAESGPLVSTPGGSSDSVV